MENPWLSLPQRSPHVLPQDREVIERFNARLRTMSPHRIHVDGVIPEPFVGAVKTAPVIVLLLNPGSDETNVRSHSDQIFRKALLANLRHEKTDWPFYFFDPRFGDEHPGVRWWERRTRRIVESGCVDWQTLAHRLAVVEWFPYKSPSYGGRFEVPSQAYGFALVEHAIDRNALIVIGRSFKRWIASVSRLESYGKLLTLRSVQNVCLTKNNLRCPLRPTENAWDLLLKSLASPRG